MLDNWTSAAPCYVAYVRRRTVNDLYAVVTFSVLFAVGYFKSVKTAIAFFMYLVSVMMRNFLLFLLFGNLAGTECP